MTNPIMLGNPAARVSRLHVGNSSEDAEWEDDDDFSDVHGGSTGEQRVAGEAEGVSAASGGGLSAKAGIILVRPLSPRRCDVC